MPSIYKRICAEYRKSGRVPYDFMPNGIGSTSVAALRSNELPRNLREVCARKTWDAVFNGGQWSIIEPIWFAAEFVQEMHRRIEAGEITREEAGRRGMLLTRESDLTQAVEVGMLLMGLWRNDLTERMMERMALHSKFTHLAVIACRDWPDSNARVFGWLRGTQGCGSVICAMNLRPENDEQRSWLFYRGLISGRPQGEMARCILARPSMVEFIRRQPDDAAAFHALCRLVCYAPEFPDGLEREFAAKLLRGMQFADQYIDLCAMHRMQRMLLTPGDELYGLWEEACEPIRRQLRMRGVIEREMDHPQEDAELLAMVLNGEAMVPPLERLMRTLATQELPDAMLRYLLKEHDEAYAAPLLECMLRVCPKAVFDEPPTVRDAREYPEGKYDIWLARALGAMCADPALEEKTILRCLGARLAAVRYQALRCLEALSDGLLSRNAEQALHRAVSQEPDDALRRRMQHMLNGSKPVTKVRCRAALPDTDPDVLRSCRLGAPLSYMEIGGREKYQADGVVHLLRDGDRLLLVPDADNPDRARVATPGGLVIGEIEFGAEHARLKQWLAEGERLIAVLENSPSAETLWANICRPLRSLGRPVANNIRPFPGNMK